MRDAARKRPDGIHLLRLRHLGFERFLLGNLHRIDDRRLFRRLVALVDDRIHIEAEMPGLVCRVQRIDRGNITLPVLRRIKSRTQARLVGGVHEGFQQCAMFHVILRDNGGEKLQERCVGAQDPAIRHRQRQSPSAYC